jgi:hypothetical protein
MSQSKKFNDWCKYFLDPQSPSYGNRTQSAFRAYKSKLYSTAGQIGYENYKKLENQLTLIADSQGYGLNELFRISMKKAMEGSYSDWERFMQQLGYFMPFKQLEATVFNQQINFGDIAERFMQNRIARGLSNSD